MAAFNETSHTSFKPLSLHSLEVNKLTAGARDLYWRTFQVTSINPLEK